MRQILFLSLCFSLQALSATAEERFGFGNPGYEVRFSCDTGVPVASRGEIDGSWDSRLWLPVTITPHLDPSPVERLNDLHLTFNHVRVSVSPVPSHGFVAARTQPEDIGQIRKIVGIQRRVPYSDWGASKMVLGKFTYRSINPLDRPPCEGRGANSGNSMPFWMLYGTGHFELELEPEVEQMSRVLGPGRCVRAPCEVKLPHFFSPDSCIQYQRKYEMTLTNRSTGQSMRFVGNQVVENREPLPNAWRSTQPAVAWRTIEDCEAFKGYVETR